AIAGLVEYHEAMTLIGAPTVNAYKRLQPAQLAGYWANWGYDHRGVSVRVPHERGRKTRIESRMADGAANPYLMTAAVLNAARLGMENDIDLPAPEEQDCLDSQSTDRHTADNLVAACKAIEARPEFIEAMGKEMVEQFTAVKRFEWDFYTEAVPDWESKTTEVTQWELDFYTPFL
ncbi:MAG: glutamine synthetase, partial [Chloroflexota bacterium]